MARHLEVLSYGEALVDFLPDRSGVPLREVENFRKTVGGAPANAAVGLARLGCAVGLLGKVGADEFGHFLRDALAAEGVDVSAVRQTREAKTGITFVTLDASGDRSFLFFREPSADMTIRAADIDHARIRACTIFLAGSNLLTAPDVREATLSALETAKTSGRFIAIDPNVRLHLWSSPENCREQVMHELSYADLLKLNEEELEFCAGGESAASFYQTVLRPSGVSALVVTRAARGAELFCGELHVAVDAPETRVVDTTGAGDGFLAGLLTGVCRVARERDESFDPELLRRLLREWDAATWQRILALACHVGSSVCTRLGATPSLPRYEEIDWNEFGL